MKNYELIGTYIADQIDMSKIYDLFPFTPMTKGKYKSIYNLDKEKFIFIYDFGSLVSFNLDKKDLDDIFLKLRKHIKCLESPEQDSFDIIIKSTDTEDIGFSEVTLNQLDINKVEMIAVVLAQSVALDHYENIVDQQILKVSNINDHLTKFGKLHTSHKNVIKMIGETNKALENTIFQVDVLDKPPVTWDHKDLEVLYEKANSVFELSLRFKNLKIKADYIDRQLTRFIEILRSRREMRLELIIIILIAIEVIIYLFEIMRTP
ncbi:MAG: RMD1 family protein [Candidatus Bathyarchaeia archaeon]|jgi:uncharacterized Rmd1/YagE family protein